MTESTCIFCVSPMASSIVAGDSLGNDWRYVRCPRCELIQLVTEGREELWKQAAYPPDYFGSGTAKFEGAVQILRSWAARRRARELHRMVGRAGRVLDVGCGEGLFLREMQKLGWTVEGCETGAAAADRAEALLGRTIHRGSLETIPIDRPWDLVMIWHALEHFPNPVDISARLAENVALGGVVAIAVPNSDSWQARLFGPSWFHLDPPRHLFGFGVRHLSLLAERASCDVVDVRHFSLEYNPFGWVQSALNALGFRRDSLYETLKSGARNAPSGLAVRFVAWFILGPSIVPAALEAAAGRGGTVVAYLRKR